MDNFNTIDRIHTFFKEVYGENYPIDEIMQNVSFVLNLKLQLIKISFI